MKQIRLYVTLFCILSAVGLVAWLTIAKTERERPNNRGVTGVVAQDFVPRYSLLNQDGNRVTEKDFAGGYQLIYFGFTFCPDICPMELQKMVLALDALPEDIAAQITPMFFTVDPVRDTPQVMKQYLSNFSDRFIGLTGTEEEIDVAIDGFKVYAARIEDPNFSDYLMDHSSYIYFIAPNGDLIALYKKDDSAEYVAKAIEKHFTKKE